MNKSNKTFFTTCSGLYTELANGLGKHGDKSLYFTPYNASFFPKYSDYCIGKGFEHIEKVLYEFDAIDKADCVCNFDVGRNDCIAFLRKHFPNKPCFGSGRAEKLENSRWGLKRIIEKLGLPLKKAVKVRGVHALSEYLLKNPGQFVKVDIFRGTINSFHSKDYKSVEILIEYLEYILGAFSEDFEFVIEPEIPDAIEIGFDGFFDGNDYVKPYMWGVEMQKDSYCGVVSDTLPKVLKETMDKLKPVLKELDYRGAISTEERVVDEKHHYLIDVCMRCPNPLGLIYPEAIDNWPEMVYSIASKKPTKLETKFKYVGCVPLYSKFTRKSDVQINFPPELRPSVKFMTAYKKGEHFYAIKDSPEELVAVVVAGDSTVDGLINKLKKVSNEVDCYEIDRNALVGLDQIKETTKNAEKIGISF